MKTLEQKGNWLFLDCDAWGSAGILCLEWTSQKYLYIEIFVWSINILQNKQCLFPILLTQTNNLVIA
jgi:hypothetical protein